MSLTIREHITSLLTDNELDDEIVVQVISEDTEDDTIEITHEIVGIENDEDEKVIILVR